MNIALVYQAGIANVFEVEHHGLTPFQRGKTKRLLQHAFSPCEWYVRGLQQAGANCIAYGCNMAGDIAEQNWTDRLDDLPFSDKFGCKWMRGE